MKHSDSMSRPFRVMEWTVPLKPSPVKKQLNYICHYTDHFSPIIVVNSVVLNLSFLVTPGSQWKLWKRLGKVWKRLSKYVERKINIKIELSK